MPEQQTKRMNLIQLTFIVAVNMMGAGIIMLQTNLEGLANAPLAWLIVVWLPVAVLFLALPFIKLATMNTKERFSVVNLMLMAIGTIAAAGLAGALPVGPRSVSAVEDKVLENLATEIDTRLAEETRAVLDLAKRVVGLEEDKPARDGQPAKDIQEKRGCQVAVTPWDTLGSGILTGKYNRNASTDGRAVLRGRNISERDLAIAAEVIQVAEKIGRTPAQVALNWVRQQPGVIVPLVGAKTRAQLDDNLGCLEFELAPEDVARLDAVSKIELGFPHDFLRQMVPQTSSLVNHRA